jgi:S1-C subfamily serine protease
MAVDGKDDDRRDLARSSERGIRRGNRGLAITAVDPNGPAAEHGMQTGDVILEVGGKKPVARPHDVREELAALYKAGKSTVVIRLKSGDSTRFVPPPTVRQRILARRVNPRRTGPEPVPPLGL